MKRDETLLSLDTATAGVPSLPTVRINICLRLLGTVTQKHVIHFASGHSYSSPHVLRAIMIFFNPFAALRIQYDITGQVLYHLLVGHHLTFDFLHVLAATQSSKAAVLVCLACPVD